MTNYSEPAEPTELPLLAFNCRPEDIASTVLLIPFLGIETFKSSFEKVLLDFHAEGFFSGFTAESQKRRISVIRTGTGSVRIIDAVLALRNCGVEQLAFAGTCGGLDSSLSLGDVVFGSHTAIIRDIEAVLENHFSAPRLHALAHLVPAGLAQAVLSCGQRSLHAAVASLPSIFLLKRELAEYLQKHQIAAVDLESAYLHQVCPSLGLDPLIMLTVSDLPLSLPFDRLNKEQKRTVKNRHVQQVRTLINQLLME